MTDTKKMLSILAISMLTACGGGNSGGGSTGSGDGTGETGGVVDTSDPFAAQRAIIKIDSNNSLTSYNLSPLMGTAFGDSTYSLVDNDGNPFINDYITTHNNSNFLTITSPIGEEVESIDFNIKYENREGDSYDTETVYFKVVFNKDSKLSGTYHYKMINGESKVNLDLSGYSVYFRGGQDPRVWDSSKGSFPQNYFHLDGEYADCASLLTTGVFIPNNAGNKDFYTCFLYKDGEFDQGLAPSQNFIDKNLVLHFSKEKAESAVSYYDALNSDIESLVFDNSYYTKSQDRFLFEKETMVESIKYNDSSFLIPGDTQRLETVLDSFGLIIKNNDIYLYNPLLKEVIGVETNFSEGSEIYLINSNSNSEQFSILEKIAENNNKVWEINKTLTANVKISNIGNVAERDGLKSIIRTNGGDYYSISEQAANSFIFKKNGASVDGAVVFSNNNGIMHDQFEKEVNIPVIINDVEYIYSFDGTTLSYESTLSEYNRVEVLEPQIGGVMKSIEIHNEKMSFENINYMKSVYAYTNGELSHMVLHEENNVNHQEFFKINEQGADVTNYNIKNYIQEDGSAAGIPSQVFVINQVVSLNDNNYLLMNANGVNVFQHQNGDNKYTGIESAKVIQGEKLNIIADKGTSVLHLCEIDDVLTEANHSLNKSSTSYEEMTLINEDLIYISNGLIQKEDISYSNCK